MRSKRENTAEGSVRCKGTAEAREDLDALKAVSMLGAQESWPKPLQALVRGRRMRAMPGRNL